MERICPHRHMKRVPLDLSLFRWIESQTSEPDRRALLSIREAVCSIAADYRYLEVGSHLGGSLQPHVVDARCVKIFSVDPRPLEQPDERGISKFKYEGNSTDRMLALLSKIPGADIRKIQTFEANSWDLSVEDVPAAVDFAFIDGEHTNTAVFRDFISVRRFLSATSILAFHDCFFTPAAILKISHFLKRERRVHSVHYFPDSVVVAIVFNSTRLSELLLNSGWQEGAPIRFSHILRLFVRRRFPWIVSAVRSIKRHSPKPNHAASLPQ